MLRVVGLGPIKIAVGKIMQAGEEHEAGEPARYFRDGQWFSVKQGDWVDPSSEIKMDFLKKAKAAAENVEAVSDTLEKAADVVETSAEILDEAGQLVENGGDLQEVAEQTVEVLEETQEVVEETKEILDETEEFIEKFEAVEKYRKESEGHSSSVSTAAAGVDIVIHAAEEIAEEDQGVLEEVAAVVQEKVEEVIEERVEEVIEENAKEEEVYEYRANEEETCEEVAAEDEADAEVFSHFYLPFPFIILTIKGLLSRERAPQRECRCRRGRRRGHQVHCQRLCHSRR